MVRRAIQVSDEPRPTAYLTVAENSSFDCSVLNTLYLGLVPRLWVSGSTGSMPHRKCRADFSRRAEKVREIADGIFDHAERSVVLRFVSDAEKLARVAPPRAILSAINASKPRT